MRVLPPYILLFELNSKATEVHFILEDFLPEKEYRNFVDQISRLDHVTHVFMPDINATKEISFSYSAAEIGTLCVLFFTSISTYLYLMKYFDDRNKYVNVVYMLSGANQQYTAMILLIQKLILVAGINLISILLHAALQNTVFQSVNILENVSYNGWDYLIIYLAMVLITVLSLIPQMVLYIRRSINTIKTTC